MGRFYIIYSTDEYHNDDDGNPHGAKPALAYVFDESLLGSDAEPKPKVFATDKQARNWFADNPQNNHSQGQDCRYYVVDLSIPIVTRVKEVVEIVLEVEK